MLQCVTCYILIIQAFKCILWICLKVVMDNPIHLSRDIKDKLVARDESKESDFQEMKNNLGWHFNNLQKTTRSKKISNRNLFTKNQKQPPEVVHKRRCS